MRQVLEDIEIKKHWWRYMILIVPPLFIILLFIHFAMATQAPYTYEEDKRFKALESGTNLNLSSGKLFIGNSLGKANAQSMSGDATISNTGVLSLVAGTTDGPQFQRSIRYIYDFAISGGSDVGTISLDASLPANAVVTRSYAYIVTKETSSPSNATTGVACGSASLQTAADETGVSAGAFIEGDSTSSATNFKKVGASPCTVILTIGTGNLTAGKFIGFANYVIVQ